MTVRIGINALYLIPGEVGGTEIYLRRLLEALHEIDQSNEYVIYVNRETDAELVPSGQNFRLVRCAVSARIRPLRIIYEQTVLPALLKRHGIAVLFNPGYTGPVATPCPTVSVFHDLQHKVHPEFFLPAHLPFWNLLLWASARKSKKIIAVSQETAADLAKYMPFAGPKISVIPHGVDTAFSAIAEKRRLRPDRIEPFLLTVSTLHPHKNLERLIEAFAVFRAQRPQYRLVVAGLRGLATARIEERVRNLHLSNSVELTGWIPRADLYSLFERAHSFIAPSLFEGFGLTEAGITTNDMLPAQVREACGSSRREQLASFIDAIVDSASSCGEIAMTSLFADALASFRAFNYEHIYLRPASQQQAQLVTEVLRALVESYADRPNLLPRRHSGGLVAGSDDALRRAVGYVAGMTDRFAVRCAASQIGWDVTKLGAFSRE